MAARVMLVASFLATAALARADYRLRKLSVHPMAKCLDGSPGAYYWAPPTPGNEGKWIVYIQGGGWCSDVEGCAFRAKTELGSSKHYAETMSHGREGLFSRDCAASPSFCGYGHIHLMYCDGGSFTGQRLSPVPVNRSASSSLSSVISTGSVSLGLLDGDADVDALASQLRAAGTAASDEVTELYFRGAYIRDAWLADMVAFLDGFSNASHVVLTGSSAGGLSTFLHADLIGDVLRAKLPNLQWYGAIPLSGYFLDSPNAGGHSRVYQDVIEGVYRLGNVTDSTPAACRAAHAPAERWRCMFAAVAFATSAVPTFVENSKTDLWQTMCILLAVSTEVKGAERCRGYPGYYVHGERQCPQEPAHRGRTDAPFHPFGNCTAALAAPIVAYQTRFLDASVHNHHSSNFNRSGNGAFLHSCFTHVEALNRGYWPQIAIGGVTMRDAVDVWYNASVRARATGATLPPAAGYTSIDCARPATHPYACNPTCGDAN